MSYFVLLFLAAGCTAQPPISGRLSLSETFDDWRPVVYLLQPRQLSEVAANFAATVLDSAVLDASGYFTFEKMPDCPEWQLFQICVQKKGNRYHNQLLDEVPATANYCPFLWKNGEKIALSAKIDALQATLEMEQPNAENHALLHLRTLRQSAFQQFLARRDATAHDEEALLEQEHAVADFRKVLMDFADSTSYFLPAVQAIRWVSPEGDFERVPEFLVRQCEKWQAKMTSHPWVAQLCKMGDRERLPILVGDLVADFPLPMLGGDTLLLHTLLGKKLTVLDFWASWCAPCRRENREVLLPLWNNYQSQGLQIIGYSIDGSKSSWQRAIEKDGAGGWLHASHLVGDAAPWLATLRLTTIPANLVLDTEGRILAKNLHGEALQQYVKRFFDKK